MQIKENKKSVSVQSSRDTALKREYNQRT